MAKKHVSPSKPKAHTLVTHHKSETPVDPVVAPVTPEVVDAVPVPDETPIPTEDAYAEVDAAAKAAFDATPKDMPMAERISRAQHDIRKFGRAN